MSRTALSVLVSRAACTERRCERKMPATRPWRALRERLRVCIEQSGKKPTREHKLIGDQDRRLPDGRHVRRVVRSRHAARESKGRIRFDKTQSAAVHRHRRTETHLQGLYKVEGERAHHHRRAGRDAADILRQGRRNASRVSTRRGKGIVDGGGGGGGALDRHTSCIFSLRSPNRYSRRKVQS